ncbi:MAG: beta-ketoacyl-[acyl-carrier-protein] synthase II [Deltaproteobacteria bacterium RIFCSPHIGHO2_12_FULL_43_9]|nr:MAG: beta-ketoacyl-[acyl-carrier-protein] synthase II [Deltaproteobacteria bacterium RIFCSPHIGHO2_12_FULL_43_9]
MPGNRRVVVTGLGAVTPLGNAIDETWEHLIAGKSGITRVTVADTDDLPTKIAGEVKGFNPALYVSHKQARRMDRYTQYGLAAAIQAVKDSGLEFTDKKLAQRTGASTGVGLGGLPLFEATHKMMILEGPKKVSPFFIPSIIANMVSGYISMHFEIHGPNLCQTTACAAGSHAIGEAFLLIRHGIADVMITGGAEACLSRCGIAGFNAMRALSTRNDEPHKASRPFDRDRDGFVMGDGAGILVLEELELAKRRGARIYAEVVGFGISSDGQHITSPVLDGEWAAYCMDQAIECAGISPAQIGYVNAHGTATDVGDIAETRALKRTFKEHVNNLNISSTKSMTGHLLGAAGGVEAIFTVLSIFKNIIPPTINLDNPDPECDLNYTPHHPVKKDIEYAMSNSFGFGGTNASLVFKRYEA